MIRSPIQLAGIQGDDHPRQAGGGIVGQMGIRGVALRAVHGDPGVQATPPSDLDGLAEAGGIGGLADQTVIKSHALAVEGLEHLLRAVDPWAFLVPGDEKADGAVKFMPLIQKTGHGGDEGGDPALHVRRSPTIERPVNDLPAEGLHRPALTHRHHIGVPGKAKERTTLAQAGVEVVHIGRSGLGKRHAATGKTHPLQRGLHHPQRPGVGGSDAGTADQSLSEGDRVDHGLP